ncbi:ABC transporter ATP-binding protein [Rhodopila sp.]|uniref:ABC transporter ATP-binding protein n=1 Tax=Rhodopila sp. TaxID=2480087 RepID=UPI002CE1CBB7|nr:ATP-binding cassette domain-containing protein [Rhodopila sp.]HVZ07006.1 ATP-binding cassette domain-containing protein [Rhodopila sp.]
MSDEILRLENVCKRFGGVVVADNISLSLRAGDVLGLIGPNGAGKTTLFNLISGLFQPDAGRIYLEGRLLAGPLHRRARAGIARTWQHMRLFRSMTVMENMLVGPRDYPGESMLRSMAWTGAVRRAEAAARDRAVQVLERMGLAGAADTVVVDLPFGQQKLIGVARALMNDGRCLLLDEPMAGVEGSNYETMQRIVRDEAASGRAVCVVEHNVSFIKDLCTEAVFMSYGRILQRGSVDDLTRSRELTDLYFGTADA